MKVLKLLILFVLCGFNALAQNSEFTMCSTDFPESSGSSQSLAPCVEYFDYYYDYLDHVQIHKPVLHFVNYDEKIVGNETIVIQQDTVIGTDTILAGETIEVPFILPPLQFVCIDDPNHPDYEADNNAFRLAKDLIFWANRSAAMLNPSLPGGAVLPNNDFKLRYTDVVDCNDIIILEDEADMQGTAGVLDIFIFNTSNSTFVPMGQMGLDYMYLKNISNLIVHPNLSYKGWQYGPLMNHEIGHDFDLCHAQSNGNKCADIPNDQICASGWIDPNCWAASDVIPCDSEGLNNTMISGAATQRGFTPCQFIEAFIGMQDERPWRTVYLNDCQDIVIDHPQQSTELDCELYVCSKLIVHTGSELVLSGEVIMAENAEIIVERGARLVITEGRIKGHITQVGSWKGITLQPGYLPQVPKDFPIAQYPANAPASLVVDGNLALTSIFHAQTAIQNEPSAFSGTQLYCPLVHMEDILLSNCEIGLKINNYLNHRSINAHLNTVWFRDNLTDDIIFIDARDIRMQKCVFVGSSEYGLTLLNTELTEFNDCLVRDKKIGIDIMTTYPYHPGFELGDDTGIDNTFRRNDISIQIGGGIGVGNTQRMEVFRARFADGGTGVLVRGNANYELFKNTFIGQDMGVLSTFSGFSENVIHCNTMQNLNGYGAVTLGDNRNLTIHSNVFDLPDASSTAVWRFTGELFRVQTAQFNPNIDTENNPPAGNQFFTAGEDLDISFSGNTIDYLVPDPDSVLVTSYYPQTVSNYNEIVSDERIINCPDDSNLVGGTSPGALIPNDSLGIWQAPIGDPIALDGYLNSLLILDENNTDTTREAQIQTEIARVRFTLHRWVVHMLENPAGYDLTLLETFTDPAYHRLMVGYYTEQEDPANADRVLSNLSLTDKVNADFAVIQAIHLKRTFPAFYNLNSSYVPTANELGDLRAIAEQSSENTGAASALYYIYTGEKIYPTIQFPAAQPRRHESNVYDRHISLDVYPNPTDDQLHLESNSNIRGYTLYDKMGILITQNTLDDTKEYNLELKDMPEGVYFLQVQFASEVLTKKIIKL